MLKNPNDRRIPMLCPNCEQESKEGKYCTNCGAHLYPEQAATVEEEGESQLNTATNKRDFSSTINAEAKHFASFFMTYLKSPHNARFVTQQDFIPAIISIVLLSLTITLSFYLVTLQFGSFFVSISFLDGFIIPFIQHLLVYAFMTILTYFSTKLTGQHISWKNTVTKVGAYTIPFIITFLIGIVLTLIRIPFSSVLTFISLLGPVIFIPSFILLEQQHEKKGYDRIYVLIGFYIVSFVLATIILQNMLGSIFGNLMENFFQGF
ncbi:zinc ribbon domain-containing protein [Virgibacillus pantothenticus]|uniref:zinc ribbon domain-containing protein n=1 Tax=Virgibacillus TaxID=84406 RepID=UPI0021500C5D|nr:MULTISPECIES: zinc ribbon domain-containing protein [Virgibacillus]MEB5458040.1 zinc ribbon domain-containing protein [Virgibacillus pantothenticus]MEB5466264.1 zinc ribbon domain-containing protein [Virgibacillus pantothenticus]MEB5470624.1 zinc ribbon domain-containing protein [Virgibacillus pantothenticus]MED3736284.1 zinc ribbon domain-containing protein [Virgibacillus pantothenticus]